MKKLSVLFTAALLFCFAFQAQAAKKAVLDAQIDDALEEFYKLSSAGEKLAKNAGNGIGGEYGEGALIIKGKKVQYYNTASASIGFQLGAQARRQIIMFLEKSALESFRDSKGWEVGVDGSVAIATLGAGGEIETKTLNAPVVGFIFGNKGLMYNLSLEGSKISKIEK